METDRILSLVQKALDEFDEKSLDISIRRAIRIAVLLAETELAIRFAQEVRPTGGSKRANLDDIKKLMENPSDYGKLGSPSHGAVEDYIKDRLGGNGKVSVHSITEIDFIVKEFDRQAVQSNYVETSDVMIARKEMREILERSRARVFAALCGWERRLIFKARNEQIFINFQNEVDKRLTAQAPDIIDSFSAVYRRLRDANRLTESDAREELSQAVTSCRRILKYIVDSVLPAESSTNVIDVSTGNEFPLDDEHYIIRMKEFIKRQSQSSTLAEATLADVKGMIKRFSALNSLASKGVHSSVAYVEAEQCAINTYILAGEILGLSASPFAGSQAASESHVTP